MGLVRFGQQKAIYERFSLKALRTSSNVLDPIPELKIQAEKAAEAMLTIALFLKFFLLFSLMKWIKRYEKFVIVRDNFKILTLDTCQPSLIQHDSVQLAQNFRKDGKTNYKCFRFFTKAFYNRSNFLCFLSNPKKLNYCLIFLLCSAFLVPSCF